MKNYVGKLIDRNLQRKRESGFTTYALYSILVLITYKITQLYSIIPLKKSFWEVLSLITCSLNIYFAFIIIVLIYGSTNKYKSNLIIKLKSNDDGLLYDLVSYIILLVPIIICLATTVNNYYSSKKNTYFIIISIIYILILFFYRLNIYFRKERQQKQ
ncbi:hypothetical protein AAFH68_26510 [Flavobacterium sp. CGRL1]